MPQNKSMADIEDSLSIKNESSFKEKTNLIIILLSILALKF